MAPLYIVRIKCSNVWLNIDVSRLRSRAFSLKQALCRPEKKRMQNKSAHTIYIKYSHFVCFECFVPCGDYGCLFVAFYGPLCIQWFWCVRVHISINSTKKAKHLQNTNNKNILCILINCKQNSYYCAFVCLQYHNIYVSHAVPLCQLN